MKKLQTLLYVGSIVIAVWAGMMEQSAVKLKLMVKGNEPCTSKVDFDGGTCPKKEGVSGTCQGTFYTIDDTLVSNNASADTTVSEDSCKGSSSPCIYYDQYKLVSCEVE